MRSTELCRRSGITWRQLCYWVEKGYLEPSRRRGEGSGTQHDFDDTDVEVAMNLKNLAAVCQPSRFADLSMIVSEAVRHRRPIVKLGRFVWLALVYERAQAVAS